MKKSKLLLSSVVMMLVSVLALTTSAYAWFVSNATPNIEQISANVTDSNNLVISGSGDAGTFGQTLAFADIVFHDTTDPVDKKISPVTLSDGGPGAGALPADLSQLPFRFMSSEVDKYDGADNDASEASGKNSIENWIQFDAYFQSSSDLDVYLDLDVTAFTSDETAAAKQDILYTLRVGFTVPDYSDAADNVDADNLIVYEPFDEETTTRATTTGNIETLRYPTLLGTNYYIESDLDTVDPTGANFLGIPLFRIIPFTTNDDQLTVKITIYIWIEGNDEECSDAAASSSFNADISFQGVPHDDAGPFA